MQSLWAHPRAGHGRRTSLGARLLLKQECWVAMDSLHQLGEFYSSFCMWLLTYLCVLYLCIAKNLSESFFCFVSRTDPFALMWAWTCPVGLSSSSRREQITGSSGFHLFQPTCSASFVSSHLTKYPSSSGTDPMLFVNAYLEVKSESYFLLLVMSVETRDWSFCYVGGFHDIVCIFQS